MNDICIMTNVSTTISAFFVLFCFLFVFVLPSSSRITIEIPRLEQRAGPLLFVAIQHWCFWSLDEILLLFQEALLIRCS
jgi:hypothetical protein